MNIHSTQQNDATTLNVSIFNNNGVQIDSVPVKVSNPGFFDVLFEKASIMARRYQIHGTWDESQLNALADALAMEGFVHPFDEASGKIVKADSSQLKSQSSPDEITTHSGTRISTQGIEDILDHTIQLVLDYQKSTNNTIDTNVLAELAEALQTYNVLMDPNASIT